MISRMTGGVEGVGTGYKRINGDGKIFNLKLLAISSTMQGMCPSFLIPLLPGYDFCPSFGENCQIFFALSYKIYVKPYEL